MRSEIEIRSNNLKAIKVGKLQAKYSADGTRVLRYFIDFWHQELDLHKELSAPELYLLQGKVDALMASWDKKVAEFRKKSAVTAGKDAADQMTIEASSRLDALTKILSHTLSVDDRIEWEALKDKSGFLADPLFKELRPKRNQSPEPVYLPPTLTFWDTLFGRKARKVSDAESKHAHELATWKKNDEKAQAEFVKKTVNWQKRKDEFDADYASRKASFLAEQEERNALVDKLAAGVSVGEIQSVIEHATLVLDKSNYGDLFEKSFEIDYAKEDRTLLVEYTLPSPEQMPTLKTARFIPATGEIRETFISERDQKVNYDAACYQRGGSVCLNSFGLFVKWISASIMLPPSLVPAR